MSEQKSVPKCERCQGTKELYNAEECVWVECPYCPSESKDPAPCPFCGELPWIDAEPDECGATVECVNETCQVRPSLYDDNEEDNPALPRVIARWNTRVGPSMSARRGWQENAALAARVKELEAELAKAREAQRWIPVGERMPEPHAVVLAWERGGDRAIAAQWFEFKLNGKPTRVWHQDSENVEADSGPYGNGANLDHRELDVIAWQPLPEGPQG